MGKKQQKRHANKRDTGLDKPAFAADVITDAPNKPVKPIRSEADISMAEHLLPGVKEKLEQLKAHMEEAEVANREENARVKLNAPAVRRKPAAKDLLNDNPDASFAELFDPAEEDEMSFADLLNTSKSDWRDYK